METRKIELWDVLYGDAALRTDQFLMSLAEHLGLDVYEKTDEHGFFFEYEFETKTKPKDNAYIVEEEYPHE